MQELDKLLWGFVFSATGIVFGWTLNQFGQWLRGRQEDKKNLKVVLYNLLETYFIFVRSDAEKIFRRITNRVFEKMPEDQQTAEAKGFVHSIFSGIINKYVKPDLSEDVKKVKGSFQNSIRNLASIDPITAYYLSGRTDIIEGLEKMENWFETLKEQHPLEADQIDSGVKQVIDILKPDMFTSNLSELERDIRNIAWKISPYTWFRSIKTIRRLSANAENRIDIEIDRLLEKLSHLFPVHAK